MAPAGAATNKKRQLGSAISPASDTPNTCDTGATAGLSIPSAAGMKAGMPPVSIQSTVQKGKSARFPPNSKPNQMQHIAPLASLLGWLQGGLPTALPRQARLQRRISPPGGAFGRFTLPRSRPQRPGGWTTHAEPNGQAWLPRDTCALRGMSLGRRRSAGGDSACPLRRACAPRMGEVLPGSRRPSASRGENPPCWGGEPTGIGGCKKGVKPHL